MPEVGSYPEGMTSPDDPTALARRQSPGAVDDYERKYMAGEGLVLHRAKQRAPWMLNALFGSLSLVSVVPVLTGVPGAWASALLTMPILFVLWMLFAVLRVTVSEGSVDIQYGLFGPTIPIASIESATATTYRWVRYGGWGIRRGPGGEWLYNMPGDGGKAVRIVWRDAKGRHKTTLVGSKDNEALAQAIAQAQKALPPGDGPNKAIAAESGD